MKNALITGAEGFIGSHLTELLLTNNYKVTALVQYNSFNNFAWLESVKNNSNLNIILGDIRDPNFCNEIVKEMDIIFQLEGREVLRITKEGRFYANGKLMIENDRRIYELVKKFFEKL